MQQPTTTTTTTTTTTGVAPSGRHSGDARVKRTRCVARAQPSGDQATARRRAFIAMSALVAWTPRRHDAAHATVNARTTMEAIDVEFGLLNDRIRACPPEHNCVSTSARVAEQYATAWTAPSYLNAKDASDALIDATLDIGADVRLVERAVIDGFGVYLRFACAGKLGEDCVEFLVKREIVNDRAWEGDDDNGPLVLFRSFALDVKYVYPFMTPVSDLGAQAKRMEKIRSALGWKTLGCEVC